MEIAAGADEIKLVGSVSEPNLRDAAEHSASAAKTDACIFLLLLAHFISDAVSRDLNGLILESGGFDSYARLGGDIENVDVILRHVFFAGHGVTIGFKSWTRIGKSVDDPQIADLPLVSATGAEFLGIL